ncbi:MAG TPA: cytochrome c maturation protein CcmE [Thermoanaerobaculia bacterium]|nr:cytochrome c maturation protein CcmE [Thermoanaerobaculia bacterium]
MNRKRLYLLGTVLLLGFAAFSLSSFSSSITPYVSFDEARAATRMVQVAGGLEKASSRYDDDAGNLHFTLLDPEGRGRIPVRYQGLKPANFEDAVSIVAIGRYDRAGEEFVADQLLVKCPSKYQGTEVKKYT